MGSKSKPRPDLATRHRRLRVKALLTAVALCMSAAPPSPGAESEASTPIPAPATVKPRITYRVISPTAVGPSGAMALVVERANGIVRTRTEFRWNGPTGPSRLCGFPTTTTVTATWRSTSHTCEQPGPDITVTNGYIAAVPVPAAPVGAVITSKWGPITVTADAAKIEIRASRRPGTFCPQLSAAERIARADRLVGTAWRRAPSRMLQTCITAAPGFYRIYDLHGRIGTYTYVPAAEEYAELCTSDPTYPDCPPIALATVPTTTS